MRKLFKNLFSKAQPELEVKHTHQPVANFYPHIVMDALYGDSVVTPQTAFKYYRENAAVATAVDIIAKSVEEIEPVLKIDDKYVTDHELIDLLKNPNGFDDYKKFIGAVMRFYLLTHNSYLLSLGNYKFPPLELYPVSPVNVSILPNMDSYPNAYNTSNTVSNGNYTREVNRGEITRFIKDGGMSELYHLMGFSSVGDNIQGDSPLTAIMGEIKQLIKGIEHNVSLLASGVSPSMWIHFPDNSTEEELIAKAKQFMDTKSGPTNAGAPMFTASDDKDNAPMVENYGSNNKDMDYVKLTEFAALTIYNRYGIPLPLVTLKASTFNNIKNAIIYLYEALVIPNINTIFGDMTKFLVPKYKDLKDTGAYITFNPETVAPLMSKRIDELKIRSEINVETVNELRTLLPNRDALEEGEQISGKNPEPNPVNEEDVESELRDKIRREIDNDKEDE